MKRTKLKLQEHLEGYKITELARHMDNMTYTQLYKYLSDNSNPTLLMLDRLARGLTKLKGEEVTIVDLLEIDGHRYKLGK